MRVRSFVPLAVALSLAACSDASRIDAPITGQLSWYAFLGGEDIQAACRPGEPARYRFVYNAVFDEQVRTYDLTRTANGAELTVRVLTSAIALIEYHGGAANAFNPLKRDTAALDMPGYLGIARQVEADGFGRPADAGRNIPSWDFYWLVTACADGKFHINAWRRGDPGFAELRFPALLFAHDKTEIPVNPVRDNPYGDYRTRIGQGTPDRNFEIQLTPRGLVNRGLPF